MGNEFEAGFQSVQYALVNQSSTEKGFFKKNERDYWIFKLNSVSGPFNIFTKNFKI